MARSFEETYQYLKRRWDKKEYGIIVAQLSTIIHKQIFSKVSKAMGERIFRGGRYQYIGKDGVGKIEYGKINLKIQYVEARILGGGEGIIGFL